MLTHEGSRRRIFPHGLPPPLGNDKRFKDYKFKRNIVEIMSKADEEDIPWEFKPTNLDEKLKRLDELEREKQEEHALDVDDLQQLYGQVVIVFCIVKFECHVKRSAHGSHAFRVTIYHFTLSHCYYRINRRIYFFRTTIQQWMAVPVETVKYNLIILTRQTSSSNILIILLLLSQHCHILRWTEINKTTYPANQMYIRMLKETTTNRKNSINSVCSTGECKETIILTMAQSKVISIIKKCCGNYWL